MKKLISVLLVLVLLVMTSAVFAEQATEEAVPSKTQADIAVVEVTDVQGKEDADIVIKIVENSEATEAVITKVADAVAAGDLTTVIPAEVLEQIPEEFRSAENLADNVKECFTLSVSGEIEDVTAATANLILETPYDEGVQVYVLFGILKGEEVSEWIAKEGTVKEDGKVVVVLDEATLNKLYTQEVVTMIFSK